MELQQLKAYLRGAIDLETAILTGELAIDKIKAHIESIEEQRVEIRDPMLPAKPVLYLSEKEPEEPKFCKATPLAVAQRPTGWHLGISIYFSLCGVALATRWGIWGAVIGIMLFFVIADLILSIPYTIRENKNRKYSHAQAIEEYQRVLQYRKDTKERYQIQVAAWEKEYSRIVETHNLIVSSYQLLQKQQQEKCEQMRKQRIKIDVKLDELRDKLWEYYNRGPIYPSYHNLVAVIQIYEYLSSGIASELEGPNGAYAQYMNDVRADQICSDLEKIRSDMNKGFDCIPANQELLCSELESVNRALSEVNRSCNRLSGGIAAITNRLNTFVFSTRMWRKDIFADVKGLHESLSAISEDTQMIALNSATMGLNQYLDMKSRGVEGYYTAYPV